MQLGRRGNRTCRERHLREELRKNTGRPPLHRSHRVTNRGMGPASSSSCPGPHLRCHPPRSWGCSPPIGKRQGCDRPGLFHGTQERDVRSRLPPKPAYRPNFPKARESKPIRCGALRERGRDRREKAGPPPRTVASRLSPPIPSARCLRSVHDLRPDADSGGGHAPVFPGHRPRKCPIQLENPRSVPKPLACSAPANAFPRLFQQGLEDRGDHVGQHHPAGGEFGQTRHPAPGLDLATQLQEVSGQRIRQCLRAALHEGPTVAVACHQQQPSHPGGERSFQRHHRVSGGAGQQRPGRPGLEPPPVPGGRPGQRRQLGTGPGIGSEPQRRPQQPTRQPGATAGEATRPCVDSASHPLPTPRRSLQGNGAAPPPRRHRGDGQGPPAGESTSPRIWPAAVDRTAESRDPGGGRSNRRRGGNRGGSTPKSGSLRRWSQRPPPIEWSILPPPAQWPPPNRSDPLRSRPRRKT